MIIDNIITGVVTAVSGATFTDDGDVLPSGAPASARKFAHETSTEIEESALDRGFTIEVIEVTGLNWVNLVTKIKRSLKLHVVAVFFNEARSGTKAASLVAQDCARIQELTWKAFYSSTYVVGVDNFRLDGPAVIKRDPKEPRKRYARIPFHVDYQDDAITS